MKKVFTLSLLSLFAGASMVAQSTNTESNVEMKKQTEVKTVAKIDRAKIQPVVKLENVNSTKAVQPIKKEEEIKSIETKQK